MRRSDFINLCREINGRADQIMFAKNDNYASDDDALENIKAAAKAAGISPLQCMLIYAHKHWAALKQVAEGRTDPEAITRFLDIINYMRIGLALMQDCGMVPSGYRWQETFDEFFIPMPRHPMPPPPGFPFPGRPVGRLDAWHTEELGSAEARTINVGNLESMTDHVRRYSGGPTVIVDDVTPPTERATMEDPTQNDRT
jgi:hypothetical protein